MPDGWTSALSKMPAQGPVMWVFDTHNKSITQMTPAAAALLAPGVIDGDFRTHSDEFHWSASYQVARSGRAITQLEWVKYSGAWHKHASTKTPAGGSLVLNHMMDVTHLDPRAEWLARINLRSQRLELASGGTISFSEFTVLHLLVRGLTHRGIAAALSISPKTVEYRISKLKIALKVDSTVEMMMQVASSGLIYLAMVPLDPKDPARSETELYKRVIG